MEQVAASLAACPDLKSARVAKMNLGSGSCVVELNPNQALFFRILSEKTGIEVEDETALLQHLIEMNEIRKKFSKLQSAYDDVMETGYGIVMPDMEELSSRSRKSSSRTASSASGSRPPRPPST